MGTAYPEDSISGLVATPERLARLARGCAEDVLNELFRYGDRPERYSDDAVRRRAEKDVALDVAGDDRCGFSHTAQEEQAYRTQYTAAYLAAWRDPALLRQLREQWSRRSTLIVCYR